MDVVDERGGGMVGIWGLKGMKVKRWEGDGGEGRGWGKEDEGGVLTWRKGYNA